MQVLVAKLIDGELAGRTKYKIVVVPVGSCVEGVWGRQEVRDDEQLTVQERTRRHPQITIRQQNDLIDGWLVLDDCLIITGAMVAPHRLDLADRIEFFDQLQKLPDRKRIGWQLV